MKNYGCVSPFWRFDIFDSCFGRAGAVDRKAPKKYFVFIFGNLNLMNWEKKSKVKIRK